MKKFFGEFKKFITRGNVVDMAVGVIVGSAFTGIVNGLSNYILKPIINAIIAIVLGKDGLSGAITMLSAAYKEDGVTVDLANSIYIDWGSFISTVINFFIVAFVLFTIVRAINRVRDGGKKVKAGKLSYDDVCAMRAEGLKVRNKEDRAKYLEMKAKKEEEAAAEAARKAEEDKINNPTAEELLKEIRDLIKNK